MLGHHVQKIRVFRLSIFRGFWFLGFFFINVLSTGDLSAENGETGLRVQETFRHGMKNYFPTTHGLLQRFSKKVRPILRREDNNQSDPI